MSVPRRPIALLLAASAVAVVVAGPAAATTRAGSSDATARPADVERGARPSLATRRGLGVAAGRSWAVENEAPDHVHTRAEVRTARRHDYVVALRNSYRGHVDAMRRANPDLRLMVYLNGAFAQRTERSTYPSSWYLRDRHGDKVRNDWGLWMMNPANRKWVRDRVRTCKEFLRASGYDGCSLDNLGSGTLWRGSLSGAPIDPRSGRRWTERAWLRATTRLASTVRRRVASAPLAVNGLVNGDRYFDTVAPTSALLRSVDFAMAETWMRSAWQPIDSHRPESAWRQDVDLLADAERRGQRALVMTKAWAAGSSARKRRLHEFALASFLLGDDGGNRFTFSYGQGADPTRNHRWAAVDLGGPLGRYAKVGGVYRRSFARGLVLVNPGTSRRRVTLPSTYRSLSGEAVRRVVLRPTAHASSRRADPLDHRPPPTGPVRRPRGVRRGAVARVGVLLGSRRPRAATGRVPPQRRAAGDGRERPGTGLPVGGERRLTHVRCAHESARRCSRRPPARRFHKCATEAPSKGHTRSKGRGRKAQGLSPSSEGHGSRAAEGGLLDSFPLPRPCRDAAGPSRTWRSDARRRHRAPTATSRASHCGERGQGCDFA